MRRNLLPSELLDQELHLSLTANSLRAIDRRITVCAPYGYETNTKTKYLVLYLLHGAGDDEEAWSSMGANRAPELDASLQGLRRQVTRFTGLHVEILTV